MVTILGYCIAFAYQKGYWQYYGVTQDFLKQISIVNILIAITVIGFSVGSLILHYQAMKGSLTNYGNSVFRKVFTRMFLPRIFVCLGILMLIPKNILELEPVYLLYLALGILITCYIFPLIREHHIKGYKNKLTRQLERQSEEGLTIENIVLKYKLYPSAKFFYLYVIFVTCFGIAYAGGYKNAVDKENYLVFEEDGKTYLVIDSNGDKFIVTPIDLGKKEIHKTFQVIEIHSDMGEPIVFENVEILGGIRVQEGTTY